MERKTVAWISGMVILIALATPSLGQLERSVTVRNHDGSPGAFIPGVKGIIMSTETSVTLPTATNSAGYLRVTSLVPGKHQVPFEARGGSPLDMKDIVVPAGQAIRADVQLQLGTTKQAIQVSTATGMIQTAATDFSTTVGTSTMSQIPLAGRDMQQLALLVPGVVGYPQTAPGTQLPENLRPSPVIQSISLATAPLTPFPSMGDLWFTTWADDDNLYGTWGDGSGPTGEQSMSLHTDCGVVKFAGDLPHLTPTVMRRDAPTQFEPRVDDKPSSVLFLDGRLYGQFHSPLGDARIGYLAYSDDYGAQWTRVGFYLPDVPKPVGASPWTKDVDSPFRCLFLINMGRNYELNTDGYVYGLGIGREWDWSGEVYLARVDQKRILRYRAWEYFAGLGADGKPLWSNSPVEAKPVPGLFTTDQGSAIYHPGVKRYLFLNSERLFDAPEPWGPWTVAGKFPSEPPEWQKGYMPGIVSKGLGPDSFWFTISGQAEKPHITYTFHIGQMVMHLASPRR